MGIDLDRNINELERTLSSVSAFPVVGTAAGGVKVVLGAAQGVTALVCGILMLLPGAVTKDYSAANYAWIHIQHGVGNMAVGLIEALPLVQTVLYLVRVYRRQGNSDMAAHISTGHEDKFMPYRSLQNQDLKISGLDEEIVSKVQEKFNQLLGEKMQDTGESLSFEEKIRLAQEAKRVAGAIILS